MNEHRIAGTFRAPVALLCLCIAAVGCDRPFRGWDRMGFQAPPERLREVDTLDLKALSTPESATRPTTRPADAKPPAKLELPLQQCRALALEGNLSLKVELLNPTLTAQGVTEAEARFEALFFADLSHAKSDTPTSSALSGSSVESTYLRPGVTIPLRTGGSITVDWPSSRTETDNEFSTLNPSYTSDMSVSLDQPLLRGGGWRTNTHAIRIARLAVQRSEALAKLEVIRVLAAADRVYWRLYAARRELEVRKQEHDLAKAQLDRARRQVAAGAMGEVEILRAELGVAERLEAIIIAENRVRDRQRDMKRILQKPGMGMDSATIVIPTTPPDTAPHELQAGPLVALALASRMELLELELQIAQDDSAIDFQRNSTLPLVTLGYTYNVNGLGDSWSNARDLTFEKRFEDHRFGLRVEIPVGNEAARSRLRSAIITRAKSLAQRRRREELITQEVHNAIDQLTANWQRILASRQRVAYAQRVQEAEVRQFNLGLRTGTEVLEAQASLADARTAEIIALAEYQIAQVDLAVAAGTSLAANRVRWAPIVPRQVKR